MASKMASSKSCSVGVFDDLHKDFVLVIERRGLRRFARQDDKGNFRMDMLEALLQTQLGRVELYKDECPLSFQDATQLCQTQLQLHHFYITVFLEFRSCYPTHRLEYISIFKDLQESWIPIYLWKAKEGECGVLCCPVILDSFDQSQLCFPSLNALNRIHSAISHHSSNISQRWLFAIPELDWSVDFLIIQRQ